MIRFLKRVNLVKDVLVENNNESGSFFDKKNLITIALVGVVFFGWQMYLAKKYPKTNTPPVAADNNPNSNSESKNNNSKTETLETVDTVKKSDTILTSNNINSYVAKEFNIETESKKLIISSLGLGIKNVELKQYKSIDNQPILIGKSDQNLIYLSLNGSNSPIPFLIEKINENQYVGKFEDSNYNLQAELNLNATSEYGFSYKVKVLKAGPEFKSISLNINDKIIEQKEHSMFSAPAETQEFFIKSLEKTERVLTNAPAEKTNLNFKNGNIIGISSHYFTASVIDKSEIIPEIITNVDKLKSSIKFNFLPSELKTDTEFNLIGYIGPKSVKDLEKIDKDMASIINLGFFGGIAKFLLSIMSWFHGFVGNWGVAIILLTLLVRLVVLPFNIASFKSMKKMQKIQPLMQNVREKYKDDPTTQQKEIMSLMRENKVNPLGGCLPMLLQMPVFFALYQCIGQSIELYQMPFFGWINDLSAKDPFYVFPVLMGATMFVQQKMTPSTMDPQQAKVMQFLPIVFSLMMINLPSGLTIYLFVSTLFGVIQQFLFMKDKKV